MDKLTTALDRLGPVTVPADHKLINPTGEVLEQIHDEIRRQIQKWGVQDHKSFTPDNVFDRQDPNVDLAKLICDVKSQHKAVSWDDIFAEEVFEAHVEAKAGNLENLRTELVQVAAVAVSWILSIDRNGH
ncbi:hypothetical protein [Pseudomonas phage Astolliot]|nr:hypothetical protein [Pseudomonas phage Astolliot]